MVMAAVAMSLVLAAAGTQQPAPAETPGQLVATYESLADVILASKASEENIVRAILASTHGHAAAAYGRARAALAAGDKAGAEAAIEDLAAYVGQLATEGDNAVGAVRKRLMEGGHHHHHHADGEEQEFDDGYVVVSRKVKKQLLDASKAIAQLSGSSDVAAVDQQWKELQPICAPLLKKSQ
jgi:hypothetical protein